MRVAIVGGGCSGALVAFHLLRKGHRGGVTIVEPRAVLARGLAFSTTFDGHLLNVVAEKMSALPEEPTHFLDWLRAQDFPGAAPGVFAPRRLYGDYLSGLVGTELSAGRPGFSHVRAEAAGIDAVGSGIRLRLSDGSSIDADKVVLALGNPLAASHAGPPPAGLENRWHASPWVDGALQLRSPGERILIVGAGQTAMDAVLQLQSQPGGCRIFMLSRSGHLPQVHTTGTAALAPPPITPQHSLRRILHDLRARVLRERESGIPWQAVVDSLRPISNQAWHGLPLAERRRFLRHLKTLWETHRSRVAPDIAERFDRYRAEGKVEIVAGRIMETAACADGAAVRVALRRGGERRIEVDRAINCTGIHEYYQVRPRPLISDLMRKGLAAPNDLGIGFDADRSGALAGPASHQLYTLGPPRRGDLFETIAIPEIRVQAEALAAHLMG